MKNFVGKDLNKQNIISAHECKIGGSVFVSVLKQFLDNFRASNTKFLKSFN
jgi:hypothetical protein